MAPTDPPQPPTAGSATPASDLAYREVKARILDHRIEGGTLISEGEIAADLQVSRTPVREAFVRLQAEGWMTLYPKRGALVRQPGPHEARDVIEARIVVESHAVEVMARTGRGREIAARLDELIEHQAAALAEHDDDDFAKIDAEFHQLIVAGAGNGLFIDFFENLKDRQRRMSTRAIWRADDRAEAVLAHHRELSRLIAEGDAAHFPERLRSHLDEVHERFLS